MGFSGGSDGKEFACDAEDLGSIPGSGKIPWRRQWLPTPVFLPGGFHGQRSLEATVHRGARSWTRLSDKHTHTQNKCYLVHYFKIIVLSSISSLRWYPFISGVMVTFCMCTLIGICVTRCVYPVC